MIKLAIFCTIIAGVIGAFVEPVSLSVSLPIAVMGGFILYELRELSNEKKNEKGEEKTDS